MTKPSPSIEELRGSIDAELHRFLATKRADLPESGPLIAEIVRLIDAGGKRLRPCFCYWAYRACASEGGKAAVASATGEDGKAAVASATGEDGKAAVGSATGQSGSAGERIVRASAALELLHTFAIVHDDIMDASDERRGEPTSHALHGVAVALLVGDLALVLADAALVESGFPHEVLFEAFAAYSRMRQQVIAGQYLDLAAAAAVTVTEAEARRIAILKSGRYSIEEPLAIGAALAGGVPALGAALKDFGAPLGEAFQLRDDLLGIFGERASLGKPIDSDIREGKRHVLFAKAAAALEGADREFFLSRWGGGRELSDDEVERLRRLVESSGARLETESLLGTLADQASAALERVPAPSDALDALRDLARRATDRLD